LLICVPVLCGGVFVVDELIELVLGDKWMPAALPLKVILGLNILRLSERFVSTAMMGIGKIDAQLYYRIFAMVVMPAAFFVGVQFGVNGLLVSWVIVLPLIYIVVLALIIKYMAINFRDFITSISSVFISSSVMLAGLYIVKRASLDFDAGTIIAINVVVGVFVFIVTLSTFFNPDFRSLINIKSILKR
ncbi:MAG: polysaccharide biosynthesis C-terminal domain-containing protein, partial [Immundisolibacteraceae bacterium]|nr:polysaccharide biosynthesis C-terminal domain-containing protein [Immundisolibacteraceae bacterium]